MHSNTCAPLPATQPTHSTAGTHQALGLPSGHGFLHPCSEGCPRRSAAHSRTAVAASVSLPAAALTAQHGATQQLQLRLCGCASAWERNQCVQYLRLPPHEEGKRNVNNLRKLNWIGRPMAHRKRKRPFSRGPAAAKHVMGGDEAPAAQSNVQTKTKKKKKKANA